MKHTDLPVLPGEQQFSLHGFNFPGIIGPSLHKGNLAQTHFCYSSGSNGQTAISLRVSLKGEKDNYKLGWMEAISKSAVNNNNDKFPYGQSETQWWEYCLAPHSYLPLNDGEIQVGLNFFNRFLHINFNSRSAQLVNPCLGNEVLSTTNWYDQKTDEMWFASWPIEGSVRRINDPQEKVRVSIWKYSFPSSHIEKVWQGDFGDSLHQLSLSPDRCFLVLTELGLHHKEHISAESPDQASSVQKRVQERCLIPSEILVLDLHSGEEWRLPMLAAGHVEFDPEDQELCYLSGHNIGLIGPNVAILGAGTIKKFRLKKNGPELIGEFSHPIFHRITTHIVFRHRGKTIIGVTGYPDTIFLIDAGTMKLYRTITMEPGEKVDISRYPHICKQDSYGIAASADGEAIFIAGTGFVKAFLIDEGLFFFNKRIENYDNNSCFTGHLGMVPKR